ncbi:myb-related transcription factor, partner of profilin-like [Strigops habroptila]|uniref:myb-related transcription factor, partner of profilin-like n=1 Tax=Strigops habroptila TaxID=2489341 RepID=UPI0011D02986|nr:myb-related transcription factor, partner of profilin-like [Strigops habroptila]
MRAVPERCVRGGAGRGRYGAVPERCVRGGAGRGRYGAVPERCVRGGAGRGRAGAGGAPPRPRGARSGSVPRGRRRTKGAAGRGAAGRWAAGRRHEEAAAAAAASMAAGGGGARRGLLKRKPNFTLQEIDILMSEVLKYEQLLFGAAASTVNAYEKQKIWWRITNKINAAGRNQRDIGEVKNRWRGLRRRANDKITRHRQERQGPAARPAPRPGTGSGTGSGSGPGPPELGPGPASGWGQRGAAGIDPPVLSAEVVPHGLKEEVVKEEPVEVKTEPFQSPAPDGVPGCGGPRPGAEQSEGWSRSPPRPAAPELCLGELGGPQEPLGSDFPSILFQQEAEQLQDCGAGAAAPAGLPDGTPGCAQLCAADARAVQAQERLVQEVRAFRREYAESCRETTSLLRAMAQALGGLSRSLAEIRDLYLREQGPQG